VRHGALEQVAHVCLQVVHLQAQTKVTNLQHIELGTRIESDRCVLLCTCVYQAFLGSSAGNVCVSNPTDIPLVDKKATTAAVS
jgi:hypothetical protein